MVFHFTIFIKFFILLLISIFVPGAFWSWAFPRNINSLWQKSIIAIFIGFVFSLSWNFLLNTLVLNNLTINILGSLVFSLIGHNIGQKRGCFSSHELGDILFIGLRICMIFSIVFLSFNLNSKWVMGGWDPGIYINQGVNIANHGGFVKPIGFSDANLTPDELLMISKTPDEMLSPAVGEEYRELLPGVRIDSETGDVSDLFLRNFPNFISMLTHLGSVDFGFKANIFVGLIFALIFFVLCYEIFGFFYALASCLSLFSHSLFLYHIKLPTTEVLQMTLFFGFVLLNSFRTNLFTSIFSALICFCAVTNRASFIGFGALYLFFLCLAKTTSNERKKDRFIFLGLTGLGLICGLIYDIIYCSNTIVKINYVVDKLFFVALSAIISAMLVTLFSDFFKTCLIKIVSIFENRRNIYIIAVSCMLVTILITASVYYKSDYLANQIRLLISYFGIIPLLFAFAGIFFILFDPQVNIYVKSTIVFLILVSIATFSNQYVANLYPWAARRYVTYTLPLLIMSAIYLPYILWHSKKVFLKVVAILLIFIICVSQAHSAMKVFICSEYREVPAKLTELDNKLENNALILVDDHRFATPLMYIYGHKVIDKTLVVSKVNDEDSAERYYNLLKKMYNNGYSLYFLTTEYSLEEPSFPFDMKLSNVWHSGEFETTEVVHGEYQRVFEYRFFAIELSLYKVVQVPEYKLNSMSANHIDIGKDFDFFNIGTGLHDREVSDGKSVRWTSDIATFFFPVENTSESVDIEVNYILQHRPVPVSEITYRINGTQISVVSTSSNGSEVTDSFMVDSSLLLHTNILEITVDPFVPQDIHGGADNRRLGIMLDSIRVLN